MADRIIASSIWSAYRSQVREVCALAREVNRIPDAQLEAQLMSAIDGLRRLDSLVGGLVKAPASTRRRK